MLVFKKEFIMSISFYPQYDLTIVTDDDYIHTRYYITRFDRSLVNEGVLQKNLKKVVNQILGKNSTRLRITKEDLLRFKVHLRINAFNITDINKGLYKLNPHLFFDNLTMEINKAICNILKVTNDADYVSKY